VGLVIQPPQDLTTLRLHDSSLEAKNIGAGLQSAVQTAEGQIECGYSAGSACSCVSLCSQLSRTGVGVEKVGTNQLIFMRSVWRLEVFSSIV
jgi:hypothetical protein